MTGPPPPPAEERSVFDKGRIELQGSTGAYWSFSPDNSERPTLDYLLSTYRLGVMLTDVQGSGFFRGNTELLLEGFYGSVYEGAGDWLAGGDLILRYNFVQPDSKWSAYVQLGAGGMWNDIYKDQSQSLIGKSFEISALAGVGLRYQFNHRWGIALEGGYRHFSNANTSDRNTGLDSLGASIGLIYSFR